MNKAEEYFWKNLPKHNLTSQNVINRQKVNFDFFDLCLDIFVPIVRKVEKDV